MIKKVKVEELRPGMFIHNFNCGWMHHPFLSNSMKLNNEKVIEKIIDYGIKEVYIDSERGLDVAHAPTEQEIDREIRKEIRKILEPVEVPPDVVPVQEEIVRAKKVKKEAVKTMQGLMEESRLGRQIEIEKVDNMVEKMIDSIFRNKSALASLGRIKRKDEYTFQHSVSVGVLMIAFGRYFNFDQNVIKLIGIGGLLHDIGKTRIPDEIITKPGKLSDQELATVKKHVEHSRKILEETPDIDATSIYVAAHHHERLDGTGYPESLKGEDIHIFGQMSAIVDVYDAVTSERCYQKKMLPSEALKRLYEWSEFNYNRKLVEHFIRCIGIYPVGTLVRLESGLLGIVVNHGSKSLLQPVVRIIYNTVRDSYIRIPYDTDLSESGSDRVVTYESPEKWRIEPERYI